MLSSSEQYQKKEIAKIHVQYRQVQNLLYVTNCWFSGSNVNNTGLKMSVRVKMIEKIMWHQNKVQHSLLDVQLIWGKAVVWNLLQHPLFIVKVHWGCWQRLAIPKINIQDLKWMLGKFFKAWIQIWIWRLWQNLWKESEAHKIGSFWHKMCNEMRGYSSG